MKALNPLVGMILLVAQAPCIAGITASVWPSASPCNTTLQACVDATPNGGAVSIVTDTPIDEDLNLYNRSLSIEAGYGYHPNFASGRWISATTAPIAGAVNVALSGLRLRNGYVLVIYNGTATGSYNLRNLELTQDDGGLAAYIQVAANAGTVEATLYDNRVSGVPRSLNNGLIELSAGPATLNASVFHNRVIRTSSATADGAGIFVDQHSGAAGTLKVHANEVRGRYNRAAIWISEGLFSSTASSFNARVYNNVAVCNGIAAADGGNGIGFVVNNGSMNAQAVNNTVSRCYYGVQATQWSGATAPSAHIDGLVFNNLVVASTALSLSPTVASAMTNDYNLINGASNVPFGTHTLTSPAQLVSDTLPRLRSTSPAINAADNATLVFGLIFNGLPSVDADGLRRIKGGSSDVDIGAYEYGDISFSHTATSTNTGTGSYITAINNPAVNALPSVNVISTANYNAGLPSGVSNNQAIGIYYFGSVWRLFNENGSTPMPLGAHFNNFTPAAGGGSFRHVTSAANNSAWSTRLDDSSVNDLPERIVLATQDWSAGSSVYNAHPIGVFYLAFGGAGNWFVSNLDQLSGGDMPIAAGFNIYAQEASPNAFRVTSGNSNSVVIDHPLLNDTPCAQVHASRLLGGSAVPSNYDVYYSGARWRIFSYSTMPAGTQFNVVVDPAQIAECTDKIFANGFQ